MRSTSLLGQNLQNIIPSALAYAFGQRPNFFKWELQLRPNVKNTASVILWSEPLLFAEHRENMLYTKIVPNVRNNFCTQHFLLRFELRIFKYWTCNSMINLSSYCRLVDAKIRSSDKDLPVQEQIHFKKHAGKVVNHQYKHIIVW